LACVGQVVRESIERIEAVLSLLTPSRYPSEKERESIESGVLLCTYTRARVGDNESPVSKLSHFVQRAPPIRGPTAHPREERMAATYLAGPRRHPDQDPS
jgi:hypothetical protein